MSEKRKQVLLIGDMVSYGKLATSAITPILSHMGHYTCVVPTALVSNNFGYGRYALLDTTAYMRQTFETWQQLGFTFDAVATGFIASMEQARLVASYCNELSAHGVPIFVDPIMGDGGALYSGMPEKMVDTMKEMIRVAHVACPNYTEACLLTGRKYDGNGISRSEAVAMAKDIIGLGARSVVVTSVVTREGHAVVGIDGTTGRDFLIPYRELPIQFSGTGDIFSAVMIGRLLGGQTLEAATTEAVDTVYRLIELNKDAQEPYKGLPVEEYLHVI